MDNQIVFKSVHGNPVTNSILVAQKFGKLHKNVIRDIDNLLNDSEFVSAQNWAQTDNQPLRKMFYKYEVEIPLNNGTGAIRKSPAYMMTRDGFTLLAMGFTGKKAMAFKIDYINAFNAMEQAIREQQAILPQDYPSALRALADKTEKVMMLEARTAEQANEIRQLREDNSYLDVILSSKKLLKVTQIAQDYGMSAVRFNRLLSDMKIQRKVGSQWIVYAPYISKGYVSSETITIRHNSGREEAILQTRWTQKGRMFLYERLKKDGVLPTIEQET